MPCLVILLALITPRLVIVLMALFGDYLGRAYQTVLWPVLGFVFMPLTTLAYAYAQNTTGGRISGIYLALVIVAVLIDLGVLGGSSQQQKKRRRK